MQVFRAATSSLSSRALARSSVGRMPRRAALNVRSYSDASTSKEGTAESKEEAKPAEAAAAENPCAEVEAKLKKKEDEVVDLTVRLSRVLSFLTIRTS